ncbi:MAG: epoxide hydrolase family protein [Pseudomonadota bacterium]
MADIRPFTYALDDIAVGDIQNRLDNARWPDPETVNDWSQGAPLNYIRDLAHYWRTDYDFSAFEARVNAFKQFIVQIDGVDIHFIHERSPHPDAKALVLTHGWPGSVLEFWGVIDKLTNPTAHGGTESDAFHVICPTLPGYGFSGKPNETGWGPQRVASAWDDLLGTLGYDAYFAQGGDWGGRVTEAIGEQNRGRCQGIHINFLSAPPPAAAKSNPGPDDKRAIETFNDFITTGSGYRHQQATRPQTLGYGLTDSPIGQLAWIIEKFREWSDCNGDPETVFSRNELLDHVTLYWLTASATSSARFYWERDREGAKSQATVGVPAGYSLFPKEILQTPESWAREYLPNLVYFNALDKGGHFAAAERPDDFVNEVRRCFALMG